MSLHVAINLVIVVGPWNHWRITRSISCVWSFFSGEKLMMLELHSVSRPKGFFWDCAAKSRRIGGAGSKCSSLWSYTAPIGSSDVTFASFSWMMLEFNSFAESDVNKLSIRFAGMVHAAIWKLKGLSCCRPRTCDPESISVNKYLADGLDAAIKSKILILPIEQPIPGPGPLKDQKLPVVWFVRCCFELDSRTISGHLN